MINLFLSVNLVIWAISLFFLKNRFSKTYLRPSQEKSFWIPYYLLFGLNIAISFGFLFLVEYHSNTVFKSFGKNTDHHFLFFKGFEAKDNWPIIIANDTSPQTAIYPLLKGNLTVAPSAKTNSYDIQSDRLAYPLFVCSDTFKSTARNRWILQTGNVQLLPAENTGHIIINQDSALRDTIGYSIRLTDQDNQQYELQFSYHGQYDTISDRKLAYGSTLRSLLENTNLPFTAALVEKTNFILLLKDTVAYYSKENKSVSLKWFGGADPQVAYWQQKLPAQEPVSILIEQGNNTRLLWPKQNPSLHINLPVNASFYLGIDPRGAFNTSNQLTFRLEKFRDGRAGINFIQPIIYKLPAADNPHLNSRDSTSLFITSNAQGIWRKTTMVSGFVLPPSNIESGDSNQHYLFGLLNYQPGPIGKPLKATFIDNRSNRQVNDGQEIQLASNGVFWKFELKNQWFHFNRLALAFMGAYLLLGLVLLFLFLKQWQPQGNTRGLQPTRGHPLIAWAIITFIGLLYSFRLFLNWRLHSFPPTENINYDTYSEYFISSGMKIREYILLLSPLILFILFYLINLLFLKKHRWNFSLVNKKAPRVLFILLLIFLCGISIAAGSGIHEINIKRYIACVLLALIFIPLFYFPNSTPFYNYLKIKIGKRNYGALLSLFAYLFIVIGSMFFLDAGFGINLLISLSICYFISLFIVFPLRVAIRRLVPALLIAGLIVTLFGLLNRNNRIQIAGHDFSVQQSRILNYFGNTDEATVESALNSKSDNLSLIHLQRAYENQYFIEQYFKSSSYFKSRLLPHSSFGSSYNTQLSDTLPVRFVIAEHGFLPFIIFLVFLVIILFLIADNIFISDSNNTLNRSNLISFITVLLFTVFSVLIVYININKIPFSGLNYLVLSLNDYSFTLVVFFILLTVGFLGVKYHIRNREVHQQNHLRAARAFLVGLVILASPLLITAIQYIVRREMKTYNLLSLKEDMKSQVELVNTHLANYTGDTISDDHARRVYQDSIGRIDVNVWLKSFAQDPAVKTFLGEDDSISYAKKFLKDFFASNQNKWNPLNLVYVERTNNGRYQLIANEDFFKKQPLLLKEQDMLPPVFTYTENNLVHYSLLINTTYPVDEDSIYKSTRTYRDGVRLLTLPRNAFRKINETGRTTMVPIAGATTGKAFGTIMSRTNETKRINGNELARIISPTNLIAKGYWINGSLQYLYPTDSANAWSYLVSQNIKNLKITEPVYLSLDMEMKTKLEGLWDNMPDSVLACISVVDGNGRVRAFSQNQAPIADGSPYLNFNYTPNQTEFNLLMRFMPSTTRKTILQNRNLLAADKPGSTIKPFTTAAVIAGANVNWQRLALADNTDFQNAWKNEIFLGNIDEGEDYVNSFAGRRAGTIYMDKYPALSAQDFLSQSKNIYHHLITYLGSFREYDIENSALGTGTKSLFLQSMDRQDHWKNFPHISINNTVYRLNPNAWPVNSAKKGMFGDRLAVLPDLLRRNYSLLLTANPDAPEINEWRAANLGDSLFISREKDLLYKENIFPDYAWFNEDGRLSYDSAPNLRNGLFNTAVGAIVYNIPPVIQAKMAINMAKVNQKIKLSFIEYPAAIDTAYQFDLGSSYHEKLPDFRNRLNETVFEGMRRSNMDIDNGTARNILGKVWPERDSLIEGNGLFMYTKTGTAVERENKPQRRKTLLVIITNGNIHSGDNTNDNFYKELKTVAIYFQLKNNPGKNWTPHAVYKIRESIKAILSSPSIKHYFNLH